MEKRVERLTVVVEQVDSNPSVGSEHPCYRGYHWRYRLVDEATGQGMEFFVSHDPGNPSPPDPAVEILRREQETVKTLLKDLNRERQERTQLRFLVLSGGRITLQKILEKFSELLPSWLEVTMGEESFIISSGGNSPIPIGEVRYDSAGSILAETVAELRRGETEHFAPVTYTLKVPEQYLKKGG